MGTSPKYAPMERPVRRCQSPISTASPKAVSVEMPRMQPSRLTTGVKIESAAIFRDRAIQPLPAIQHGVEGGVRGQLQPRGVEALLAQPQFMLTGPRLPAVVDDPLAQ